jgi:hypothetical protein
VSQVETLLNRLSTSQFHSASSDVKVTINLFFCFAISGPAKKRKVGSECPVVKGNWSLAYFIIENMFVCVTCNETIVMCKEYNIHRHYEMKHASNYKRFTGILPLRPDRLWGPPSLLYNGYRGLFPRG